MELRKDPRLIVPVVLAEVISAGFALRDLARRSPDQVRGPKLLWRILILANAGNSLPYWLIGRRRS